MPKITVDGGPSYAGYVDVSPEGVDEPAWAAEVESPPDHDERHAKPAARHRARNVERKTAG